jgi:cob(I)alamin adenosyltransferase
VELNSEYQNLEPLVQKYLNRLSDTLFVLGRFLNAKQGVSDVFWVK